MPRRSKKDMLPEDLMDIVDRDAQDDLRTDEEILGQHINNDQANSLAQAYKMVASTREGVEVLRHIMQLSGYKSPIVTFSRESLEVNPFASIYNASKRDVWLEVSRRLPAQLLREIENPLEVQ